MAISFTLSKKPELKEFCSLSHFENKDDELFAQRFFETRADYNSNYDTSDLFEATEFFQSFASRGQCQRNLQLFHPKPSFNLAVFKSYGLVGIPIFGQERLQKHGTKFNTLLQSGLIEYPEHVLS